MMIFNVAEEMDGKAYLIDIFQIYPNHLTHWILIYYFINYIITAYMEHH